MKIIYVIAILGAIVLIGCKTKKNTTTATSTTPPKQERDTSNDVLPSGKPYTMLEYSKGMCFGKCPVYNISINSDGNMEYFGKMHVDKLGTYSKRLSKGELSTLYTELKTMNLFQYDEEYGGRVMDISKQELTYREAGKEKKIICKLGYPDEISALITKIDKIANSNDGWELTKPLPDRPENNNQVDRTTYDEVIVYINKDFDINKWAVDYDQYDLTVKKSLSPNGFIWLLGFNPDKVGGKELVQLLRDDPDIVKCDLNQKVTPRN